MLSSYVLPPLAASRALWQIAVAQYSDEPRTEFHFNQYKDRNGVLKALKELQYTGGNTKTGGYRVCMSVFACRIRYS